MSEAQAVCAKTICAALDDNGRYSKAAEGMYTLICADEKGKSESGVSDKNGGEG